MQEKKYKKVFYNPFFYIPVFLRRVEMMKINACACHVLRNRQPRWSWAGLRRMGLTSVEELEILQPVDCVRQPALRLLFRGQQMPTLRASAREDRDERFTETGAELRVPIQGARK
jgi:hypothetical protein